jgi:uncharacterized protein (UPF0261 family)
VIPVPRVLLMGTYRTKGDALRSLHRAMEAHGLTVDTLDLSLAAGTDRVSGPEKVLLMQRRAAEASADVLRRCGDCVAAVGLGGGTGAEIVMGALQSLPATYPKILVSTLPFDPRPMVADSAITLVPTLCDIEGTNAMLEQVLENTAAAVAGLARARPVPRSGLRSVAVTTLGATGVAGGAVIAGLKAAGLEPVVFHANGFGGAAFARFLSEGRADGVIDLTTHELGRLRIAGAHVRMPGRFSAAAALPRVVLPGGLNFLGLGAVDTVAPAHLARPHYRHTGQFTHVKLTEAEMAAQAAALAGLLNRAAAPCHVILPMGGFSHEDAPGGAIEDPALRGVLARGLERAARAYTVRRMDAHINDPEVAAAAVAALFERMPT